MNFERNRKGTAKIMKFVWDSEVLSEYNKILLNERNFATNEFQVKCT